MHRFTPLSVAAVALIAVATPGGGGIGPVAWPLAAGALSVTMGHGAIDLSLIRQHPRMRWVLTGYLIILLAFAAWWHLHAASCVIGFLVVTATHFGLEEIEYFTRGFDVPRWRRIAGIVGHGSVAALLPVVLRPAESVNFFNAAIESCDFPLLRPDWSDTTLVAFLPASMSVSLLVIIVAVSILGNVAFAVAAPRRAGLIWLGQTMLLAMAVWWVDPIFWFGIYLLVWHVPRHVWFLNDRLGSSFWRRSSTWIDAMIFFLPAVALVGFWAMRGEGWPRSPLLNLAAASVAAYTFLTPPHHVLQWSHCRPGRGPGRPVK